MKTVQYIRYQSLLLFLISSVLLTCSFVTSFGKIIVPTCMKGERDALLIFKEGLIYNTSRRLSSWTGRDCCTWKYVTCSITTGHVVKLDLRSNDYYDGGETFLRGKISSSLINLTYLNYLDLSMNNFDSPVPEFLGSLKELTYLNLSYALFGLMIPPQLGNLSKLRYLDIQVAGSVSDLRWLSRLSSLEYINLSNVNLSLASDHWVQSLNMLPSLSYVNLRYCGLNDIPQSLPKINFSSLSVLDVGYNHFSSSSLPQWLYNLSTVKTLDLSGNGLKGEISDFMRGLSLYQNGSLEELYLTGNQFFGELPHSLGDFKELRLLHLENNSISGQVPENIFKLENLEELDLSTNQMNGSIPEKIHHLVELKLLDMSDNMWEGVMSEKHIQDLRKLEVFSISSSGNDFRLNISQNWVPPFSLRAIQISNVPIGSTFPAWIGSQEKLSEIILTNVSISGEIPIWLWKFSPKMHWLDLSNNKLNGSLPDSLEFKLFARVDLSFNDLEGEFPLSWQNLTWLNLANNKLSRLVPGNIDQVVVSSLQYLNISTNLLYSKIPPVVGQMKFLMILDLSGNKLFGEIPYLWDQVGIQIMDLSNNNLSGTIPDSIFELPNLTWLELRNNNLSGTLNCTKSPTALSVLDLGVNNLSGNIPKCLAENFQALSQLRLRSNKFSDTIPEELCDLPNLHILDLALNNLSGSIPQCLEKWNGFRVMTSISDSLVSEGFGMTPLMYLTFKGRELIFTKVLMLANFIDLSSNNLCGEIPRNITSLSGLRSLNLSMNQLTGMIPKDIEQLKQLESLDLSCNHLSGQIPPKMSLMTSLNFLNLSWNNLSGPIPSTNQFQTFNDPSIYEGNAQLCGDPLPTPCKIPQQFIQPEEDDHVGTENIGIYISSMSGFVIGFLAIVYCSLLKAYWRNGFVQRCLSAEESLVTAIATRLMR